MRLRLSLATLLPLLGLATCAWAQKIDSSIAIGTAAHVWSDKLQEERRLLIYLPPHYAQSTERYPVVYLLDAEAQFYQASAVLRFLSSDNGRIPEMIVIGITNSHRNHDLTPAAKTAKQREEDPDAGGADAFLTFLVDELAPWVNARYRAQPYRILVGHSLGGLFAVHTLLSRPDAFQAYLAISPSLWFDDRAMVKRAEQDMPKVPAGPHYLRLTWADNEQFIRDSTQELVTWMKANPPGGLQWAEHYYPGEDHSSVPLRALYDGMEDLFAGWRPRYRINDVDQPLDMPAIDAHFAALSKKYGYVVRANTEAIDFVAQALLEKKQYAEALALLRRNVQEHSWIADVHEELAEGLKKMGRPEEAALAYKQALKLRVEDENPYRDPVTTFRENMKQLER